MQANMRIVLDKKPNDPDPIDAGEQATVLEKDSAGHLIVSWDNGRKLNLIIGVDKYHAVKTTEELDRSFKWLYENQMDGESGKCPRCGKPFDVRRGAVSRRKYVMVCDLCGQQEAM